MAYRGRNNSRGGPRRHGRSSWSSQGKTRRGGRRGQKTSTLGRIGIGLGIVGAGALAVAAGVHGLSGFSHSVKSLAGDYKAIKKWATVKKATKEELAATTVKFHASRVKRITIARKTRIKFRSPHKTKIGVRRHSKR